MIICLPQFAAYPECYKMVSGIALHWYYDWLFPASSMDDFHETFPDKLILYTESSPNKILFGETSQIRAVEIFQVYYIAFLFLIRFIKNKSDYTRF